MNNLKSKAGFTLVELIVVIAILAILAGVGTAAYTGYIAKANEAADYTLLDSVKTAVIFAAMEQNPSANVTKMNVTEGSTSVTVTATVTSGTAPSTVDVSKYVSAIDFKSANTKAEWSNNTWTLSN